MSRFTTPPTASCSICGDTYATAAGCCADCGRLLSDVTSAPRRSFRLKRRQNLVCLLCTRTLCDHRDRPIYLDLDRNLMVDQDWHPVAPNQRCRDCGGSVTLGDDVDEVRIYTEAYDWRQEIPTRGRPSNARKALLESDTP